MTLFSRVAESNSKEMSEFQELLSGEYQMLSEWNKGSIEIKSRLANKPIYIGAIAY